MGSIVLNKKMRAFLYSCALIAITNLFVTSLRAQSFEIASYDINQRIEELGGGPFCINQFDGWQKGEPRNMYYLGKDANATCNSWAAGQMSSDRRSKSSVSACSCR